MESMANGKILIFGSGGHGKVVLDILLCAGCKVLGFIDEDKNKIGQKVRGYPILDDWAFLKTKKPFKVALGIGNNKIRYQIYNKIKKLGYQIASAIHPKAVISQDVKIGEGVVIMPGTVINPGAILEDGVVVNTGATVDHDCHLKKFCQVWPGAHLAGGVELGEFSYVGTGASVIQYVNIGKNVMIGAGGVVLKDIPDKVTAVGVPVKIIK